MSSSNCCFLTCIQVFQEVWYWEGLGAGGEGDDRGWDGWMASLTRWTWVSVNSGSWWGTGRPGVLRFMGSQHTDTTEWLIWSDLITFDYNHSCLPPVFAFISNNLFYHFSTLCQGIDYLVNFKFFSALFGKRPHFDLFSCSLCSTLLYEEVKIYLFCCW